MGKTLLDANSGSLFLLVLFCLKDGINIVLASRGL